MTPAHASPPLHPRSPRVQEHRERVWAELAKVGRPDARLHWDFSSFIADFEGSDLAAERIRQLRVYQDTKLLFITPDNSTELVRRQALADGKIILMTTCAIARGFLYLDSADVPEGERSYAATLDGMERFSRPVSLSDIMKLQPIRLLVTGGSAVSRNGVRFGKGHGYFDVEWAMLSEIDMVGEFSEIVDIVHDCQVVDELLAAEEHDVPVDWIVTPSRTLAVIGLHRPPGRVRWEMLEGRSLVSFVASSARNCGRVGLWRARDVRRPSWF